MKIICEENLTDVANAIMHEVFRRYSDVFSRAIFASDVQLLKERRQESSFLKAPSMDEWEKIAKDQKEDTIGVFFC